MSLVDRSAGTARADRDAGRVGLAEAAAGLDGAIQATGAPAPDGAGADAGRTGRRRGTTPPRWLSVASVLAGFGAWELVGRLGLVDPLVLPPLSLTLQRLVDEFAHGGLAADLWASALPFLAGTLLAVVLGCVIGALMGRSVVIDGLLGPWVLGLNAVPRIAFVSIFIVVFGLGIPGKTAVVVATATFPMILTMRSGVRSVDPEYLEMATAFRASRRLVVRHIVVPATLSYFVAGFRITIALALIGEVVAEFFSSSAGIGHRLQSASQTYDITEVYSMIILLAVIGIACAQVVNVLERRIDRWQGPPAGEVRTT